MNEMFKYEKELKLQPFKRFNKQKVMNSINHILSKLNIKTKINEDALINIFKRVIENCCVQKYNIFI